MSVPKLTPEEAQLKYDMEWPILNAAKEAAVAKGDDKLAKKCRQALSYLSKRYEERFKKDDAPESYDTECPVYFCPCCGKRVTHD